MLNVVMTKEIMQSEIDNEIFMWTKLVLLLGQPI